MARLTPAKLANRAMPLQDALAKGLKDKVPKTVAAAADTLVKVVECALMSCLATR